MKIRVGFVGSRGIDSFALGESLHGLLPPDCELVLLTMAQAAQRVASDSLTIIIVALDGESWRDNVAAMTELHAIGERRASTVFGLVPRVDPAALVKAFDLGVADVAGLPIDPHEVRARLAVLIRRRMVAAARHAEMRAAWRLATTDPVTGLFNRAHLETILPAAVTSARVNGRPLALLLIDLDALKPFNDRWGHAAGDALLRRVAELLTANVRAGDTVARLGGDEMAVVMPDTDPATSRRVAERLVAIMSGIDLRFNGEATGPISASVGLAMLGSNCADASALMTLADSALYRAKAMGRNQVVEAVDDTAPRPVT